MLKSLGILGTAAILPAVRAVRGVAATPLAAARDAKSLTACWLTPSETEGPYYFNPNLVRRDITEGFTGVPLHLVFTIIDANCNVIPNALVDIWHASKDGVYSGYNQPGGNTIGQTFLRGIQSTDSNGVAEFDTVYPGWYQGRATHIHFKVRNGTTTYLTSQFAFPAAITSLVYASPLYAAHGQSTTSNAADMVFGAADPQYEAVALSGDVTNGYTGTFTAGINGASTSVPATPSGTLRVDGAIPNPSRSGSSVALELPAPAHIRASVRDVAGRLVRALADQSFAAGRQTLAWDGAYEDGRQAPGGLYFYAIEVGDRRFIKAVVVVR